MAREFYPKTDGNAVDFELSYTITGEKPILVNGIPGFPSAAGVSGDVRSLATDGAVYRVNIGASLTPSIGDILYVTKASVTAHEIPAAAYTLTADGASTAAFLRVLSEKDANNWVDGKLINI